MLKDNAYVWTLEWMKLTLMNSICFSVSRTEFETDYDRVIEIVKELNLKVKGNRAHNAKVTEGDVKFLIELTLQKSLEIVQETE